MISLNDLENELKKNIIHNCYVFCGIDELLIKESVKLISDKVVNKDFFDLNFIKYDGNRVDFDAIMNACETMPFMGEKKVVLVYRADFLSDNKNKANDSNSSDNIYKNISNYIDNIPEHCVLIMYYIYQGDREKVSNKVKKLQQKSCVGEFSKLKGVALEKKVKGIFNLLGKDIGKTELLLFCANVENNLEVIYNEAEKLSAYTLGREIKKEDILISLPRKSENDIFNLVDFISQKKAEKALDILNELLYRGEKNILILSMIQRQFKLILLIKLGLKNGKTKEILSSELNLHPYICEKMMQQSKNFTEKSIKKILNICIETEKTLKSSTVDNKTELELLIISALKA